MLKGIPIGREDFKEIRENDFYYVDKTKYTIYMFFITAKFVGLTCAVTCSLTCTVITD